MMSTKKHIRQLERRADYLARRIAESKRIGKNGVSYDVTELNALNWAIRLLVHLVEDPRFPYVDKP